MEVDDSDGSSNQPIEGIEYGNGASEFRDDDSERCHVEEYSSFQPSDGSKYEGEGGGETTGVDVQADKPCLLWQTP